MKPVRCEEMYHGPSHHYCSHPDYGVYSHLPETTPSRNEREVPSSLIQITWQEFWQAGKEQCPENTLMFVVLDLGG